MRRYQRFVRHRCALEGAASQHFLRIAVAIDDHRGHEPFAIELSADRDPLEHNILLVPRFIASATALLDPRIPAEIRLLRGTTLWRRRLFGALTDFRFVPRFYCRPSPTRSLL